jgi:tetratricopeptide (TPR) repeat protein
MTTLVSASVLAGILAATAVAQDTEWAGKLRRAGQAESGGHYLEAIVLLRQAAALADGFGPRDSRTWATYDSLAIVYENAGLTANSIRTYRHAIAMVKAAIGKQNEAYARLQANLGTVYLRYGDIVPAASMLREALQIETQLPDPDPIQVAAEQSRLAEALASRRRYEEAERMLELALPVLERAGQTSEVATTLNSLGMVRSCQRRYDESLELIGKAVATVEEKVGSEHPLLLRPLNNLALVYALAGRTEEAGATFRRALAICEKSLPPDHPSRAALLVNYARFLRGIGERTQAKAMEAEARSLARDNARRDGLALTVDVSSLRQE